MDTVTQLTKPCICQLKGSVVESPFVVGLLPQRTGLGRTVDPECQRAVGAVTTLRRDFTLPSFLWRPQSARGRTLGKGCSTTTRSPDETGSMRRVVRFGDGLSSVQRRRVHRLSQTVSADTQRHFVTRDSWVETDRRRRVRVCDWGESSERDPHLTQKRLPLLSPKTTAVSTFTALLDPRVGKNSTRQRHRN